MHKKALQIGGLFLIYFKMANGRSVAPARFCDARRRQYTG